MACSVSSWLSVEPTVVWVPEPNIADSSSQFGSVESDPALPATLRDIPTCRELTQELGRLRTDVESLESALGFVPAPWTSSEPPAWATDLEDWSDDFMAADVAVQCEEPPCILYVGGGNLERREALELELGLLLKDRAVLHLMDVPQVIPSQGHQDAMVWVVKDGHDAGPIDMRLMRRYRNLVDGGWRVAH